MTTASL